MTGPHAFSGAPAPDRRVAARGWLMMTLLGATIVLVYWPVRQYGFVAYDDPDYVSENRVVQAGLTWHGVKWAFTTGHASNWHPLTWLSHMLDVELFGRGPAPAHLVNVGLHAANVALVFALLRRLSGSFWLSAAAAALFGLHPLRVESVAWIAERKDVLCGFFFLLSLWAYGRWASSVSMVGLPLVGTPSRSSGPLRDGAATSAGSTSAPGARGWYAATLFFFACALLSKPMAVTLPCVLLLLDFWPLGRTRHWEMSAAQTPWRSLVAEKLPFFALSIAAGLITLLAQARDGAVRPLDTFPILTRMGNALVSYARYLEKTFWPADLAVFYPHPGTWSVLVIVGAAATLIVVTVVVWRARRKYPAAFVGWAWFCGMLVPTIGLVQVGGQAMADRYSYLPSIGLCVVIAGVAAGGSTRARSLQRWSALSLGALIVGCAAVTRAQLAHWRDSESLFRRALAVTAENYVAHNNLAGVLLDRGEVDAAIEHASAAIALRSTYADAHSNLGQALLQKGEIDRAAHELEIAARLTPEVAEIQRNLGNARLQQGRTDDAIAYYEEALRLSPDDATTHNNLGWALFQAGRGDEAIAHLTRAISLEPDYGNAHHNLAGVLAGRARISQAVEHLQHAASAYASKGDFAGAIAATEKGLQLLDAQTNAAVAEALRSQSAAYRARSIASQP